MIQSEPTTSRPYEFHHEAIHEASMLRDLYHPTIIAPFEIVDEPKKTYLFLELCFGGTLSEAIGQGPYPEKTVRIFTRNLLKGLQYLHSRDIAHRTINPFNVCIYQQKACINDGITVRKLGLAKIIDFGQAVDFKGDMKDWGLVDRQEGRLVSIPAGEVQGRKLAYVAPDLEGKPVEIVGRDGAMAGDVWALGMIVHELLTGEMANGQGVSSANFQNNLWQKMSDECVDFCYKMLLRDSRERIKVEQALVHPWIYQGLEVGERDRMKIVRALHNFTTFKPSNQLQITLLSLLAHRLVVRDDHEDLAAAFLHLDQDSDGALSLEVFTAAYKQYYLSLSKNFKTDPMC